MGKQILESKIYSKFVLTAFNRNVKGTERLEKSMMKYGFRDVDALDVKEIEGGKLQIRQGHHRFYVAQKLGIPVKYVVSNDDATIFELEGTKRRWSMEDYLDSYCRVGLPEYLKVREYCDESGISLNSAMSMLGGHSAGSGNFQHDFKSGEYKIRKGCYHAEIVKDIVLSVKKCGVKFYASTPFVQAVSKSVWVEKFSVGQFKAKIRSFARFVEKKATLEQYLDMIEEIYNRQSRTKVPLKFLAVEEAKRRNAIVPGAGATRGV